MTKPQSREKAEKMAREIVNGLVADIADALTPQLELLAECEQVLEPFGEITEESRLFPFTPFTLSQCRAAAAILAKIKEVGK